MTKYLIPLKKMHQRFVNSIFFFLCCNIFIAQSSITIINVEDRYVRLRNNIEYNKLILEICHSEKLKKRKAEMKQDSISIAKTKHSNKPITVHFQYTKACKFRILEEISKIPYGKYHILNRNDFYEYSKNNHPAYFIFNDKENIKYYISYPLDTKDNFDITPLER